jgi:hypothetical protein
MTAVAPMGSNTGNGLSGTTGGGGVPPLSGDTVGVVVAVAGRVVTLPPPPFPPVPPPVATVVGVETGAQAPSRPAVGGDAATGPPRLVTAARTIAAAMAR